MPSWVVGLRPSLPSTAAGFSLAALGLGLSAASVSAIAVIIRSLFGSSAHHNHHQQQPHIIPSPLTTQLPHLTPSQIAALPYPPDILPGARSVPTPYGTIHVFEFGPDDLPASPTSSTPHITTSTTNSTPSKILLLHGLSTPSPALASLALHLARLGHRVCLFDLFGRGYSDTPTAPEYNDHFYATQILMVLASSPVPWTGDDAFHLVGYSLGGGLAVAFARWWPRLVRSVVLIAGGGLLRRGHVGWGSRVLYGGWNLGGWEWVEGVRRWVVRRRLGGVGEVREGREGSVGDGDGDGEGGKVVTETGLAGEVVAVERERDKKKKHGNSDASGGDSFDNAVLLADRPEHTVSSVMAWQLRHHEGFVRAFISTLRHAPIYEQTEHWRALGQHLAERRKKRLETGWEDAVDDVPPGLRGGKILLVLGASDPVIVKEELLHDATAILSEDGFEAVVLDAGHEVVMTKAEDVAAAMDRFWKRYQ